MSFVKFHTWLLFQLVIHLFSAYAATSQSYTYTDREMLFDDAKEDMQVMLSADGSTHVWRWGNGRVTMDVYDKQLHLVQNQIVSRHGMRLLFASFKQCYYVLMMEPKTTKVLCIQDNEVTDKTTDFNKIPTEEMPIAQIRQGDSQWFFIQYSQAEDEEHSMMHITAVDSGLHYINSMHLTLRYTPAQLRRLHLYTLGNDLLMVNTTVEDPAMKLTVHQLNVTRSTVRSNSFWFNDEMFVPQAVLPYRTGFVLQGQGFRPLSLPRRQTAYTYLLQLDSGLQQVSSYHTNMPDSSLSEDAVCWYLPVSTTVLPNYQLLVADYQRSLNRKTKVLQNQLRFTRLDTGFVSIKTIEQPGRDYNNYPGLVFSNGPQVIVFYEETIRNNITVVHRYRYGEEAETDRIVPLKAKNRYVLKKAIRNGETSFIMPYIRNYRLGLVRVNVPVEE